MEPEGAVHERPVTPLREGVFAALAIVSVLIGLSRIENPLPAPLWMKALDVVIASAFLFDWMQRIHGSNRPFRYFLTHLYEVLFFIPFTLLPTGASGGNVVRGGRLLRLLRFARYGRYTKLGIAMTRLPRRLRHLRHVAKNAQLVTIFVSGAITVSLGAVGLFLSERDAADLGTFAEAWWWSLSLFTTVAYAVPEPRTTWGHAVSGALMVAGVVYVGLFTASLASAILRTPSEEV